MRKRSEIKAVWDSDLEHLLASIGILDDVVAGKLNCAICGGQVNLHNLGAVFPRDGQVAVSCDNSGCVHVAINREAASVVG